MQDKEPLTKSQQRVFDFIKETYSVFGYVPSIREIGEALELSSTQTVHHHLTKLEEKGYIKRSKNKARTIEIVCHDKPLNMLLSWIPVLERSSDQFGNKIFKTVRYVPLVKDTVGSGMFHILKNESRNSSVNGIMYDDYMIVDYDLNNLETAPDNAIIVFYDDNLENMMLCYKSEQIMYDKKNVKGIVQGIYRPYRSY